MKKILLPLALALFLGFEAGPALKSKEVKVEAAPIVKKEAIDPLPEFSEPHIVFHYFRNDGLYDDYALWLWDDTKDGREFTFTHGDDYGKYLFVPRSDLPSTTLVNFIIKSKGGWDDFQTADTQILYADHTYDEVTMAYHFYILNGLTNVYKSAEEARANSIYQAHFTAKNKFKIVTNNKPLSYDLLIDGVKEKTAAISATYSNTLYTYSATTTISNDFVPNFSKNYEVDVTFEDTGKVKMLLGLDGLYDDEFFVSEMTYDGEDLGVTFTPAKSTFKAWAPTVSSLELRIYNSGTPKSLNATLGDDTYQKHDFVYKEKGVWEVEVAGNLHGKYYTFVATHPTGPVELVDPYAKSAGINGVRGMIVDFAQTNPIGWENVDYSVKKPTEIVPYEVHVADLTSDETWTGTEANRKKFLGLAESGTTYTKNGVTVKTGFDHVVELGVNALQIIPFYDQNNDERNPEFNWGYNPLNYDVLEGSYSSDPYDGLVRIREFKQVVQAYAAEDIRIIMDVVYNHVASMGSHSFTRLVPGYYFRYTSSGSPDNSSGVGNVTASERAMMQNFMRDSTAFWVSEYKIGGFRFDLMGLHTTDSMNAVSEKVKAIRDDVIIFGEAWDMDQTNQKKPLAIQKNMHLTPHVGAFNDEIRDSFASNDGNPSSGWVQIAGPELNSKVTIRNRLKDGMLGKIHGKQNNPAQTINYAACHDNYTLYDKLRLAGTKAPNNYALDQIAQQSLQVDSMVLLSQGVSFIHGGSDILRSKPKLDGTGYDHNSYMSPYEVNSFKWDEKVDNLRIFENYQALLALKTGIPALQYMTREEVDANVSFSFGRDLEGSFDDNLIKITTQDSHNKYTIYFYGVGARLKLNDLVGLEVVLDTTGALEAETIIEGTVNLTSNMTLVVKEASPTPPVDPEPDDKPGLSTGAIVGISVGSAAGLGGIGTLLFFLLRKRVVKV